MITKKDLSIAKWFCVITEYHYLIQQKKEVSLNSLYDKYHVAKTGYSSIKEFIEMEPSIEVATKIQERATIATNISIKEKEYIKYLQDRGYEISKNKFH